jgi:hypothetical protein
LASLTASNTAFSRNSLAAFSSFTRSSSLSLRASCSLASRSSLLRYSSLFFSSSIAFYTRILSFSAASRSNSSFSTFIYSAWSAASLAAFSFVSSS